MQLLVELLVGQLLPSFYIVWYDFPTNSLTNYPTINRISWIWMRKKIGLQFRLVIIVIKACEYLGRKIINQENTNED